MNLLTLIRQHLGHDEKPLSREGVSSHEAFQAKENAQLAVREAEERKRKIGWVAQELQELRTRNHFGESIEAAMMRRSN